MINNIYFIKIVGATLISIIALIYSILNLINPYIADSFSKIICVAAISIFTIFILGLIIRFMLYKTILAKNSISLSHNSYELLLSSYMQNNKLCDYLENKNLILYFNNVNTIWNIRVKNKKNNKTYEIRHKTYSKEKVVSLYGLIQMSFNEKLTFGGLIFWLDGFEDICINAI